MEFPIKATFMEWAFSLATVVHTPAPAPRVAEWEAYAKTVVAKTVAIALPRQIHFTQHMLQKPVILPSVVLHVLPATKGVSS
jgi:hypothetical protein